MPLPTTLRRITERLLQPTLGPDLYAFVVQEMADVLDAEGAALFFVDGTAHATTGAAPEVLPDEAWTALQTQSVWSGDGVHAVALPGQDGPAGLLLVTGDALAAADEACLHAVAGLVGTVLVRRTAERALNEAEARSEAILDAAVDAIITIDRRGIIRSVNPAAERIFGYAAAEVVGQNVHVLMPEPYHSEHDGYLEHYHDTGQRRIIGIGREVTGRRKSGEVFPMYLGVSEVKLSDRTVYTGIVQDLTERRRLEQEVLRTSDDERRRIGQDLHDGLGQMLSGIGLVTANVARRLERQDVPEAEQVHELSTMIREADAYARSLARGLVPVELEQGGLRGALQRLTEHARRLFGIECHYTERGQVSVEDPEQAMHLYRIAQEAVSNAVRHGKAANVGITLSSTPAFVRLRVRDDGSGFAQAPGDAPPETFDALRGMGLRIMHYRARIIGAALDVESTPGEGTVVTCTLRLHGETPARGIDPQLAHPDARGTHAPINPNRS